MKWWNNDFLQLYCGSRLDFKTLLLSFKSKTLNSLSALQKWCQMKIPAWWRCSAQSCSLRSLYGPAFVCNHCLIKHAGQLRGSGWRATDTRLNTECLWPASIRDRPRSTLWPFAETTAVLTSAAASICDNTISPTHGGVSERLLLRQPSALPHST